MFYSSLEGKNVLLGVTGGIAAYKTPELVRLLKKTGAQVKVIMSKGAAEFVTATTLETVSANQVYSSCAEPGNPMLHIELARWADYYLIAPLTANRLAGLAHGFADDLLTTVFLATQAQVWVAPAMNKQMWEHPYTQQNLNKLSQLAKVIGPDAGEQACLEVGYGRMTEPQAIVSELMAATKDPVLAGKTVMITAGPTQEPIDPVRYVTNRSSGKMGYHLAKTAAALGARVMLVSGPVSLPRPAGVKVIPVKTAKDMYEAVTENLDGVDIFIGAAAVADFRPKYLSEKIKKQPSQTFNVEWIENPDILATVAAQPNRPFCVGFAAETHQGEQFAKQKLTAKALDMIALNAVDRPGVGFEVDTNALDVYGDGYSYHLPLNSKEQIAQDLLQLISKHYHEKEN